MLLTLRQIQLGFGGHPALDGVDLKIAARERIALVGRNGSGKTTLMKVISGELAPDDGQIEQDPGMHVARLVQEVPTDLAGTVYDVVATGLGPVGDALTKYNALTARMMEGDDVADAMAAAQADVDALNAWDAGARVESQISQLGLEPNEPFASLSGGRKRRVLLGKALVSQPDLLLLDEPTNHLDIESIAALEANLLDYAGALLFITHDRAFLRRLATRIVELDRGRLTSWPGDYDAYLSGKEKALEDEAKTNALFDKKLAQEEVWIRQGIKARRTRNEGRVRALKALRDERRQRRDRQGVAKVATQDAERSGKRVAIVEDINYSWPGGEPLVRNFSTLIQRGDKIGIIGPNGAGKTTLIKLLLGQLAPDSGTVKLGTKLDIAHFDQHRSVLDDSKNALDNVAEGRSEVTINGKSRHVISYLQDFLFAPDRARAPITKLSGGERNRLLLAKLFTQPANLLVMDEPTNDLDVETLELLEERLIEYPGTLLLVSHDRAFLDAVVTSTLVFEGNGFVGDYVGGYSDWLRQRRAPQAAASTKPIKQAKPAQPKKSAASALTPAQRKRLTKLPGLIEQLEDRIAKLEATMADAGFYTGDADKVARTQAQHAALNDELAEVFEEWEQLEAAA